MPAKFSLQSVLDFRHQRVEVLEVDYAQALRTLQAAQERLQALRDALAGLFEALRREQVGALDLFAVNQTRLNIRSIENAIEQQTRLVAELAQAAETRRLALVKAKQDEEALEKLKAREEERWQQEQQRQENTQRDDIYIARAHRQAAQNKERSA